MAKDKFTLAQNQATKPFSLKSVDALALDFQNLDKKGLKKFADRFKRKKKPVTDIEANNKAKRANGVLQKQFTMTFEDGQKVTIAVKSDGTIFQGVNIENAAYTPTICAERCAIFKAVSEGYRDFKAIAVVGCDEKVLESNEFKNQKVLPEGYGKSGPCGVCRQVMQEFCDPETFDIILGRAEDDITVYKLKELFPHAFGPADLA